MTDVAGREPAAASQLQELADAFHLLKIERAAAQSTLAEVDERYTAAEAKLFDALEGAGLTQIRTGSGLFSLNDLAWPKIEDPAKALAWAEAEAPEFITLNHQRLQVPIRERIRNGEPMPPGITFTTSRKINHRLGS